MFPMTYVMFILVSILVCSCMAKPPELTNPDDTTLNAIDDNDGIHRTEYALKMLSYMNFSVQPCDDFYEYACGNWKNTIQERQCEKHRNNFYDAGFTVNDFIDQILKKSDINEIAPDYADEFDLAKKFYNNCLETELYPMRKSQEYLNLIQNIGGFPAMDPQWNASQFSWVNMSAHLSNYGVKNLINEVHLSDHPFTPFFPLPDFGFDIALHYETIINISSIEYQTNKKRMRDILTLYAVDADRIDLVINDIFEFLKATLNMMEEFEENQGKCEKLNESLETADYDALQELWVPYFDIAWNGKSVELGGECGPCVYFNHKFTMIAEKHEEAIANYLSLMFLHHMDANLQDPKFQKDFCTSSLKLSMIFFFDHLYMKTSFNEEISDDVRKMAKEIQESLRTVLQEVDWLDEPTREAALLKESLTGLYVGRFEDTEVIKRVLGEIKRLEFVEGSYESNRINLLKHTKYMERYLGLHADDISNSTKAMELMIGIYINCFYHLTGNNMYIMAGVLQPPSYNQKWPNSLKFGGIGFLLGHELTHGFDTTGSYFDHIGEFKNWWSDDSKKNYNERAECFVNFFNNYTVPEIHRHINGEATKDENIADAGALHLAMMAYRRHAAEESKKFESMAAFNKEEQMPGMDVTPEQLFFLGAAQTWCASFKMADYWKELYDDHTIDKYRVLGMVSNNEDFAKAYNCPVGSAMNPTVKKCKIW